MEEKNGSQGQWCWLWCKKKNHRMRGWERPHRSFGATFLGNSLVETRQPSTQTSWVFKLSSAGESPASLGRWLQDVDWRGRSQHAMKEEVKRLNFIIIEEIIKIGEIKVCWYCDHWESWGVRYIWSLLMFSGLTTASSQLFFILPMSLEFNGCNEERRPSSGLEE